MPRKTSTSNFVSDNHTLYAGWVLGEMLRSGLPVEPVLDPNGNYTNRVLIRPPLGGDLPPEITLLIPPPPDGWSLFGAKDPPVPVSPT
jgi:hypothetical protein